jgi:hypothetical protein
MDFIANAIGRILFGLVFVLFMATAVWVLYRLFPNSRVKGFLFKVRGTRGSYESRKDKVTSRLVVTALFLGLALLYAWLMIRYSA